MFVARARVQLGAHVHSCAQRRSTSQHTLLHHVCPGLYPMFILLQAVLLAIFIAKINLKLKM